MIPTVTQAKLSPQSPDAVKNEDDQTIPHSLEGAPFLLIANLFRKHGFRAKAERGFGTWGKLFALSLLGSPFRIQERLSPERRRALSAMLPPPLFLIGHWRSGTTHLHNLMTCDPQFGYMSLRHCITADSFLTLPKWVEKLISSMVPEERPVDGVKLGWGAPQEEEFVLERTTELSYNHCYLFPDRAPELFRRSVLLDEEGVRDRWQRMYDEFLRRLSYDQGGRPLCLKNPPNTGRLKLLNEMYPEAKFVFIVRHPEHVFRSTRKLWKTVTRLLGLTRCDERQLDENFLSFYELVMQRYLADRAAIPADRLIEIKFEDLEHSPVPTIARIYEQLGIYGFHRLEPKLREYLGTLKSFTKNPHVLEKTDRETVHDRWGFAYDAWQYERGSSQHEAA
jgi:omega-hydroxy-beta-dihydromenaquinone-9 sulfotransferase